MLKDGAEMSAIQQKKTWVQISKFIDNINPK
jgi:hypothetical protein